MTDPMTTPPLGLPALRAELRSARRVAKQHMHRAEKAEQERDTKAEACRTLGQVIKSLGDIAVEATDSQSVIGEDGDGDWDVVWDRVTELGDKARQATARAEAAEAAVAAVREALEAHPKACDRHTEDDPIKCGWKRAVADVTHALDGGA